MGEDLRGLRTAGLGDPGDHLGHHRFEWPDVDEAVEFHLSYGNWIRLLRRSGFEMRRDRSTMRPDGSIRLIYSLEIPERDAPKRS